MATSTFFFIMIKCFVCLCLICTFDKSFAKSHDSRDSYSVQFSSLLPSSICNPTSKVAPNNKSSLKVVHKYSPCSNLHKKYKNIADLADQILQQDQSRVDSIRSRLQPSGGDTRLEQEAAGTTLPAKSGRVLGSANYFVTVGLGTPKNDLSLIFDTGSDLTWTQCQPCDGSCYPQKEKIFDPSASTTYAAQSCSSPACTLNFPFRQFCTNATKSCEYVVQYADGSFTQGDIATETLTLTSSDVMDNFVFGCGQQNGGLFVGVAGLLGLGRGKTSIIEQTAQKFNRIFSYCLPTASSSSTGSLTFGTIQALSPQFTPMLTHSSFYGLQISSIAIGGRQLAEAEAVLQSSTTIIDSGAVITRLPPAAYRAMSAEFKKYFTQYPPAAPSRVLDTCYDLSGVGANETIAIPKISISFNGGATLDLLPENILFATSDSHLCLAFTAGDDIAVVGNVQQMGFDVVYDIPGARIGFSPSGC